LIPVTITIVPAPPVTGATVLTAGMVGLTVKMTEAVVVQPPAATLTFAAPSLALAATVKVAVICEALTTVTALTATPVLFVVTVAPVRKFVPARVTGTMAPWTPAVGAMVLSVGAFALRTVVGSLALAVPEPPPETLTQFTSLDAALAPTFTVTVIAG
jgi:hypothetical protein